MENQIADRILIRHSLRGITLLKIVGFCALSSGMMFLFIFTSHWSYFLFCFVICLNCFISIKTRLDKNELTLQVLKNPQIVFWLHWRTSYIPQYKWLTPYSTISIHLITGELLEIEMPQNDVTPVVDWFRNQNPDSLLFIPPQEKNVEPKYGTHNTGN